MNSGRPWSDDDLALLHRLLAERRLDYSGIAKAMGRSKDSIIGKTHRLKLPSPPSFYDPARRGPRGQWLSPVQRGKPGRKPAAPPVVVGAAPAPVSFTPYQIATPPVRTCQWIDGDRPWRFCGAPVAPGRPYCRPHVARAYTTRSALREMA